MKKEQIKQVIQQQRTFFHNGNTLPVGRRIEKLNTLYTWIQNNERAIHDALHVDLNKSDFESYMSETGTALSEIRYIQKHLPKWARKKRVRTPLSLSLAKSYILHEPYGTVLILSPWNYPFLLALAPLMGAIAAGNTAIIKPSPDSPATSALLSNMISACFDPGWATVIEGGLDESNALLDEPFDYIFFTGSVRVGKIVMEKAARHLCPVTLELGGKSPAIVDKTANIPLTAKRLAFGKFLNAGQTCVAPDYALVHQSVKDALMDELKKVVSEFYTERPLRNASLVRIVNERHFKRLLDLYQDEHIVLGGGYDETRLIVEPTVVDRITFDSPIMEDEIFGPILPVIVYTDLEQIIRAVAARPKPLALYLFTQDTSVKNRVLKEISFGGGCINDTVMHTASPYLGFGGVGNSGMGSYHGRRSYQTFTHEKSILDKSTRIDPPMRYAPYTEKNLKMVKMLLK